MTRLVIVFGPLIEALKERSRPRCCLLKTIYVKNFFCISDFFLISLVVLQYEEKHTFEEKSVNNIKDVYAFVYLCLFLNSKLE